MDLELKHILLQMQQDLITSRGYWQTMGCHDHGLDGSLKTESSFEPSTLCPILMKWRDALEALACLTVDHWEELIAQGIALFS